MLLNNKKISFNGSSYKVVGKSTTGATTLSFSPKKVNDFGIEELIDEYDKSLETVLGEKVETSKFFAKDISPTRAGSTGSVTVLNDNVVIDTVITGTATLARFDLGSVNLTNKSLSFNLLSTGLSQTDSIWLDISTNGTDYMRINLVEDYRVFRDGDYRDVTASLANLRSVNGTTDISNIRYITLRVNSSLATKTILKTVSIFNTMRSEPAVAVVFDDGYISDLDTAYPIMKARNIVGTSYVIEDSIGKSGRMNEQNLQYLQSNGWSVGAHASLDFTTIGRKRVRLEAEAIKSKLISIGLTGYNHFAYPMGKYDASVIDALTGIFYSARSIDFGVETTPVSHPMKLRTFYCTRYTTPAQLTNALNSLKSTGGLMIITFHRIVATTTQPEDVSTTDFTAMMNAIQSSGIKSVNIETALE